MTERGYYTDSQIQYTCDRVEMYLTKHRNCPGFFDMAINSGKNITTKIVATCILYAILRCKAAFDFPPIQTGVVQFAPILTLTVCTLGWKTKVVY